MTDAEKIKMLREALNQLIWFLDEDRSFASGAYALAMAAADDAIKATE